ncbi:MAG TPA: HAD-IIB family hydrolase [Burkholderiales bacterium]|nr:HAD-IIB family hydrolase [Burkholderiales bacterium]
MTPLSRMREPARLRGLLFDIDETLTTEGRLTAGAYSAMETLKRAGRLVVPITGRPAGWCDHIARMWPVDAVVGENGAFYFRFTDGRLVKRFQDDEATRAMHRAQLKDIGERILREIPGCALASDQAYRESDLAIDFCEDVPPLPLETAERIAALMRAEGLTAKISSIHVNGWFGGYDKLAMAKRLFSEAFALDADTLRRDFAFAGDSPNDAPMFAYFDHSVGVANVARFAGRMEAAPKFVTRNAAGAGFAEIVAHLVGQSAGER